MKREKERTTSSSVGRGAPLELPGRGHNGARCGAVSWLPSSGCACARGQLSSYDDCDCGFAV